MRYTNSSVRAIALSLTRKAIRCRVADAPNAPHVHQVRYTALTHPTTDKYAQK